MKGGLSQGEGDFPAYHRPVLLKKVTETLAGSENLYVDCTVGEGGHAEALLKADPKGELIGIDLDPEILERARKRLKKFGERVLLVQGNFAEIDKILWRLGLEKVDVIFYDLGVSSFHLASPRGFSFSFDSPLDMRYDASSGIGAAGYLNRLPEEKIADTLFKYGEERYAKRIARKIVEYRKEKPIKTTWELVQIIESALPPKARRENRIHPATRTFLALRILVNRELENLEKSLSKVPELLTEGGRVGVISFHSLEHRIVKKMFREFEKEEKLKILTKEPITPDEQEIRENPRSRSAQLRIAVRVKS